MFLKALLTISITFSSCLLLGAQGSAGVPATMAIRNSNTTIIGTAYTSSNASLGSAIKGVANIAIVNGSTLGEIAISVKGTACDSGTVDAFAIPASTSAVFEDVAVGKVICVRSLTGSNITSGKVYLSVW